MPSQSMPTARVKADSAAARPSGPNCTVVRAATLISTLRAGVWASRNEAESVTVRRVRSGADRWRAAAAAAAGGAAVAARLFKLFDGRWMA